MQVREFASNSHPKTQQTWLQNRLGNGNAFQTRGGHTEDKGCRGFTAAPRRAKTLAPTGKRRQR